MRGCVEEGALPTPGPWGRLVYRSKPRLIFTLPSETAAWRADGRRAARGMENLASEPDDLYLPPYEGTEAVEVAMRAYLDWEVNLPEQLAREGVRYKVVPAE